MRQLTHIPATGVVAVTLALSSGALLSGCKSNEAAPANAPAAQEKPAAPAKVRPAKGVKPPAEHRMAKLQLGMSTQQVDEIMGPPTHSKTYITGMAFNPISVFRNDGGNRVEYAYRGEGRVVFVVPAWGGALKAERIDYDPTEDGR